MECIITIDINTSAVKVHVYNLNGQDLYSRKGTYPTFHPQPDWSEQDPEQVFITTLFVVKNLLNEFVLPQKMKVSAICLSGSMHSVLPVNQKGVPLGNAIIWADNRGIQQVAQLNKSGLSASIYQHTGTPIHPMSPLMKIAWLQQNQQPHSAEIDKYISLKEYVIKQLTGEYIVDHSIASSTGLFDIHRLKWHTDALDFAGIKPSQLSETASVFYHHLKLKKEYATTWGISEQTPIILGASDGCLATLGAGIVGEGKATITIGSSAAVRVAGKSVLEDTQQRLFNYILAEGYYISGGPSNNAGVVFEWFAKQFGDFSGDLSLDEVIDDLFKSIAQIKVGSEGLIFLPYLLGERAPIWNANARGTYFGLNINHTQQHITRATLEGILFEIYSIGKLLEQFRIFDHLYVNGTFASHPICLQILADMFGKNIATNLRHDGVSTGAALMTLTHLGVFSHLEEASKTVRYDQIWEANPQNHQKYQQYFTLFQRLTDKLSDEFDLLASIGE
jgi:gluconokinase